ncbi:hypothetical protein THARTR1_03798 [Trichoderma harzianum]|uniref:Uncharacterized protein n=1 Tax=Trichoderma harzianum TaxID=5544 RepID=A0A2K0UET8_TRIHA|nr:hypothetical protein THARTR1_03798 [Trichoderma harzianum]
MDGFSSPENERVEMKDCITETLEDLCLTSDEQINWNFNQLDGYGVNEPNISNEKRERFFPDDCRPGSDDEPWPKASTIEELEYLEVKTTTELPFEIPKSSQYERPTIVPVKAKS